MACYNGHMLSTQPFTPDIDRLFRHRFVLWASRGIPTHAATVLADAGCETIEEVRLLGREYFENFQGCGKKTLQDLALIAGWPPPVETAADAIAAALSLSISDPEEAHEVAADVIIALRRSGFVVSTSSAPAGRR